MAVIYVFTKGPFFSFSNKKGWKETRRETRLVSLPTRVCEVKELRSEVPPQRHGNHLPGDVAQGFGLMCNCENEERGADSGKWLKKNCFSPFFFKKSTFCPTLASQAVIVLTWMQNTEGRGEWRREQSIIRRCSHTRERGNFISGWIKWDHWWYLSAYLLDVTLTSRENLSKTKEGKGCQYQVNQRFCVPHTFRCYPKLLFSTQ